MNISINLLHVKLSVFSSAVRTSVFVQHTFPNLCPICGWQMTTLLVNWLLLVSQLGHHSLLSSGVG